MPHLAAQTTFLSPELSEMSLVDFIFGPNFSGQDLPWYTDALTGQSWTGGQIKARVQSLAGAFQSELGLGSDAGPSRSQLGYLQDVVSLVSPNDIDFSTVIWAGASPTPFFFDELLSQLLQCIKRALLSPRATSAVLWKSWCINSNSPSRPASLPIQSHSSASEKQRSKLVCPKNA